MLLLVRGLPRVGLGFVLGLPYGQGMDKTSTGARPKVTAPHISLQALRLALRRKQEDVCNQVTEYLQADDPHRTPFTKGGLSAIENGIRGASPEILSALELVFGLRAGDLTTDYTPRARELNSTRTDLAEVSGL